MECAGQVVPHRGQPAMNLAFWLLVLAALALTWLSGYWMGRSRAVRSRDLSDRITDDLDRETIWEAGVEHGREVERRHILTDLWTRGRTANPETRPRA